MFPHFLNAACLIRSTSVNDKKFRIIIKRCQIRKKLTAPLKLFEKGNNVDWPYVDRQKGNNVDTLLGTFPNFPNFLVPNTNKFLEISVGNKKVHVDICGEDFN